MRPKAPCVVLIPHIPPLGWSLWPPGSSCNKNSQGYLATITLALWHFRVLWGALSRHSDPPTHISLGPPSVDTQARILAALLPQKQHSTNQHVEADTRLRFILMRIMP